MSINWKALGRSIGDILRRRSPEILTGIGIAGMAASVVLAVRATPKAMEEIKVNSKPGERGKEFYENGGYDPPKNPKPIEIIKLTWKYYIPAVISFTAGAGCVIFASRTNYKRNAALAAAYSVTETALQDYKTAAKEVLGERKEEAIDEKAKHISADRHEYHDTTYVLNGTDVICYDPWSDRDFPHDVDELKRAIEDLSYQLRDEEFITLNEFYDLASLNRTKAGEILGWNASGGPVRPRFSTTLINDKPCLVLGFSRDPTDDYRTR